jgi:hypothetical protein
MSSASGEPAPDARQDEDELLREFGFERRQYIYR